jgi:hypothetical protein
MAGAAADVEGLGPVAAAAAKLPGRCDCAAAGALGSGAAGPGCCCVAVGAGAAGAAGAAGLGGAGAGATGAACSFATSVGSMSPNLMEAWRPAGAAQEPSDGVEG